MKVFLSIFCTVSTLPPGGGDLGGDLVDRIFDAFFFARRVQYEQAFVSFHCSFPSFAGSLNDPVKLTHCFLYSGFQPGFRLVGTPQLKLYPPAPLPSN